LGYDPLRFCVFRSVANFFLLFRTRAGRRGRVTTRETTAQENQKKKEEKEKKKKNNNNNNKKPVVPNVVFCTHKKLAVFLLLPPLYPAFLLLFLAFLLLLPGAGQPIQIPPPSLETSSCQGTKRAASPHSNRVAVKKTEQASGQRRLDMLQNPHARFAHVWQGAQSLAPSCACHAKRHLNLQK